MKDFYHFAYFFNYGKFQQVASCLKPRLLQRYNMRGEISSTSATNWVLRGFECQAETELQKYT